MTFFFYCLVFCVCGCVCVPVCVYFVWFATRCMNISYNKTLFRVSCVHRAAIASSSSFRSRLLCLYANCVGWLIRVRVVVSIFEFASLLCVCVSLEWMKKKTFELASVTWADCVCWRFFVQLFICISVSTAFVQCLPNKTLNRTERDDDDSLSTFLMMLFIQMHMGK